MACLEPAFGGLFVLQKEGQISNQNKGHQGRVTLVYNKYESFKLQKLWVLTHENKGCGFAWYTVKKHYTIIL